MVQPTHANKNDNHIAADANANRVSNPCADLQAYARADRRTDLVLSVRNVPASMHPAQYAGMHASDLGW